MPIVCGTALGGLSREALEAAAAIANRMEERELHLVHVQGAGQPEEGPARGGGSPAARAQLEEEVAFLRAHTRAEVDSELLAGDVSRALLTYCECEQASLLIVSSKGHRDSPLFRLGGVSERLAQATSVPLLIVRDAEPFQAWERGERPLRLLLGVDWTKSSEPATRWVYEMRESGPCEVVVAHVYFPEEAQRRYGLAEPVSPVEPDARVERLLERDLAQRVGAMARARQVSLRTKLAVGRKGDHHLAVAEAERADVIVFGTHHRRGPARLASVSSVALHFGRASMALIPSAAEASLREAPRPVQRVLIATDMSRFSREAIPFGYRLLAEGGGEVTLLYVSAEGRAERRADPEVDAHLRALVPEACRTGAVVTRTEVVHSSDVAGAICEAAERVGADVVCLTSHGRSGLKRTLLGSVAEQVLRRGCRPLLIVHPPPP